VNLTGNKDFKIVF